jgi:hypothetical protein
MDDERRSVSMTTWIGQCRLWTLNMTLMACKSAMSSKVSQIGQQNDTDINQKNIWVTVFTLSNFIIFTVILHFIWELVNSAWGWSNHDANANQYSLIPNKKNSQGGKKSDLSADVCMRKSRGTISLSVQHLKEVANYITTPRCARRQNQTKHHTHRKKMWQTQKSISQPANKWLSAPSDIYSSACLMRADFRRWFATAERQTCRINGASARWWASVGILQKAQTARAENENAGSVYQTACVQYAPLWLGGNRLNTLSLCHCKSSRYWARKNQLWWSRGIFSSSALTVKYFMRPPSQVHLNVPFELLPQMRILTHALQGNLRIVGLIKGADNFRLTTVYVLSSLKCQV